MKAIILTKSAMNAHGESGVCTTAYDMETDRILRLVSNKEGGPIPDPYCRRYQCFDMVNAEIIEACPIGPQTENVLVDLKSIEKITHVDVSMETIFALYQKTVANEPMFMYRYFNKMDSVELFHHSLEILKVNDLKIELNQWGKTSASFIRADGINHYRYNFFSVTDKNYMLEQNSNAKISIQSAYIIVSIPYDPWYQDGEFKGYYKFIAAIYPVV